MSVIATADSIFNIFTEYVEIDPFQSRSYLSLETEFTETVILANELLGDYLPESAFITEEVKHGVSGVVGKAARKVANSSAQTKQAVGRTIETTKGVAKTYGDITTSAGDTIYQTTRVAMGLSGLVTKAIALFFKLVELIPRAINAIFGKINSLKQEQKSRLLGQMELNITANNFDYFDRNVKDHITTFINISKDFVDTVRSGTSGNSDSGWLDRLVDWVTRKHTRSYRQMENIVEKLLTVRYTKSTVTIKTTAAYNIYFVSDSQYYKYINDNIAYFKSQSDTIKNLHSFLSEKFTEAELNRSLAKRTKGEEKVALNTVKLIGSFHQVIARHLKCLIEDLSTINKRLKQALAYETKRQKQQSKEVEGAG